MERRASWAGAHMQAWDGAMAALREAGWQVTMTCLAAPVQLEGVLPCGERFYFRTRHDEVLLAVGGDDPADSAPWQQETSYGRPGESEASEVSRSYGVARSWVYALLARPALSSPSQDHSLGGDGGPVSGPDRAGGPRTVQAPEAELHPLRRRAAHECWQADFTHYPLAEGTGTEILTWLDDHSRYALSVTAHTRVTGPIVVETFHAAVAAHGAPASTLTDNGMFFTTRFSGGKDGISLMSQETARFRERHSASMPG